MKKIPLKEYYTFYFTPPDGTRLWVASGAIMHLKFIYNSGYSKAISSNGGLSIIN